MEEMLDLKKISTTTVIDMVEQATPIVILPHMPQVPRLYHLQCVSAMTGHGLLDGIEWLYANLEGSPMRSG